MTIVVTQFALPARLTTNEAKAIFNSRFSPATSVTL
jgi:hypothetical protein